MTPEGKLKQEVKAYLIGLGPSCWYYMPVPVGYGKRGIPDFIGCYRGYFFGIETKAPGGKPTEWQTKTGREIGYASGAYMLAYSLDPIKIFIRTVDALLGPT